MRPILRLPTKDDIDGGSGFIGDGGSSGISSTDHVIGDGGSNGISGNQEF